MVNTIGILTALVLAFTALVAFKNKEEYSNQVLVTKNEASKRDRNTKTFESLREDIAVLEEEKDVANKSRDEYQVKLDEQERSLKATIAEVKESKADMDQTTASLEEKRKNLEELGPMVSLGPEIERLTVSSREYQDQLAILATQNSRLRNERTQSAARLDAIKKKLSDITSGRSLASMKTRISSISRTLGFVTLSGGIKAGVVGGSKVAVVRDGEKIAELNVTAVSANTATADIIRSTLKEGESVSVGDKVVAVEPAEK